MTRTPPKIREILTDAHLFSQALERPYEVREGQIAMAESLAGRTQLGQVTLVEAGTGTGKSFAYLLPLLLGGKKAFPPIVSTYTIQLQQQLLQKDIPALERVLTYSDKDHTPIRARPIRAVVMLGRSNFVSVRRARFALDRGDWPVAQAAQLQQLQNWLETTDEGLLEEIPLDPDIREAVESQSDNCLGARCPNHDACFYFQRRRAAAGADVLIVNHALLTTDMAIRQMRGDGKGLLPGYSTVVVDEAHHLAGVATEHLGTSFSAVGLRRALALLAPKRGRKTGLLDKLASAPLLLKIALSDEEVASLQAVVDAIRLALPNAREQIQQWQNDVRKAFSKAEKQRIHEHQEAHMDLRAMSDPLLEHLGTLVHALDQLTTLLAPLSELPSHPLSGTILELAAAERRIRTYEQSLNELLWKPFGQDVHFLESSPSNVFLHKQPLMIGPVLVEALWHSVESAWLTSATLQTGSTAFKTIRTNLGLVEQAGNQTEVEELVVPSPFVWEKQVALFVDTEAPHPNSHAEWEHHLILRITRLAAITEGRMLVLMTNTRQLAGLAPGLKQALRSVDLDCLVQGELPRQALLERFKQGRSVLFGLQTFWEGVDLPGPALSAVVIPRIPFPSPADPWVEAYCEAQEQQGISPFQGYMLPEASIKLRQGFGRLIRTTTDTGICIVLDPRLDSQPYGRVLKKALPQLGWTNLEAGLDSVSRAITRLTAT